MSELRSRAIVAEGQNFYSAGLAEMLQREIGFAEVARVFDHEELLEALALQPPASFVALDIGLPGLRGEQSLRQLRQLHPALRVAALSEQSSPIEILALLAAGANGVIPRQIGIGAELLQALNTIVDGHVFVPSPCPETETRRGDEVNGEVDLGAFAGLTQRQQQVIRLLSEGCANKVIARELGISPSTVKVHVHAAFRVLGVHSRLAAVAALRPGHHTPISA